MLRSLPGTTELKMWGLVYCYECNRRQQQLDEVSGSKTCSFSLLACSLRKVSFRICGSHFRRVSVAIFKRTMVETTKTRQQTFELKLP